MTDERVDQLLRDLDAALSMDPSPAVAASARRRVAAGRVSFWVSSRRLVAVGGVVTGLAATIVIWARVPTESSTVMAPVPSLAAAADIVLSPPTGPPRPIDPATTPSSTAGTSVAHRRPAPAPAVSARKDAAASFDVVVSPDVRLGLRQLARAVANGRITAESFSGAVPSFEPTIVTPTVIVAEPLVIGDELPEAPAAPASGGVSRPVSYRSFTSDQEPLS